MRYVPYDELGGEPNIVVDGFGTPSTILVLSHWPGAGTPDELQDDLSTQIAFRYLDRPDLAVEAGAVSNNHFDQDGLCGIFAVLRPEEAVQRRRLLVDVAAAGDFSRCDTREAARIAFALAAYEDVDLSPLDRSSFTFPYPEQTAVLYRTLLDLLPEMLDDPGRYRRLWEGEDARLSADEDRIARGAITIEERPEIDLAIVRGPTGGWPHEMAIHNRTRRFRVLELSEDRYRLRYRYESWVAYVSEPVPPRIDLAPLAHRLTELEASGAWAFDGVEHITPSLHLDGPSGSSIAPARFVDEVAAFLAATA